MADNTKTEEKSLGLQVDLDLLSQGDTGSPDDLMPVSGENILTDPNASDDILEDAGPYTPGKDALEAEKIADEPIDGDSDLENTGDLDTTLGQELELVADDDNSSNTFQGILQDVWGKSFGEDESLPDDVTEENLIERIGEKYLETKNINANLPPEVQEIAKAMEEGLEFSDVIKSYKTADAVNSMSDEEIVKRDLVNRNGASEERPHGWSKEKVEDVLSRMKDSGMLEIQADTIRSNSENIAKAEQAKMSAQRQQEAAVRQAEDAKRFEEDFKTTTEEFLKLDDVWGLEVSESDKQTFSSKFRDFVTPKEDGTTPYQDLISNNLEFAKLAYVAMIGKDGVKSRIHNEKEGVKNRFLQRLDDNPRQQKKGIAGQDPNVGLDYDALASPEILTNKE